MEDMLREIWPTVEKIGPFLLFIVGGPSFYSLNFYFRTCRKLRKLEEHLVRYNTIKGFKESGSLVIWFFDIFYGFKPLSKFKTEYKEHKLFRELLEDVTAFRKFYKIVFPTVIILAIIGVSINELIIDK